MSLTLFEIEHALSDLMEAREDAETAPCGECAGLHCAKCNFTGVAPDAPALEQIDRAIVEYITAEVKKVDNIARFLRRCEEHAESSKREAERLRNAELAWLTRRERVRDIVLQVMRDTGQKKLEGATYTLKRQVNGGKRGVDVKQPEMVPDEMLRFTLVMTGKEWLALRAALDDTLLAIMDRADSGPNLVTIWQALEAGEGVAGCALKERGEHVRIA